MLQLLLLILLPGSARTECDPLISYLRTANYTVGNTLTKRALTGAQREKIRTGSVQFSVQDTLGCCDEHGEQVLRHTAGDAFLSVTFQLIDRYKESLQKLDNTIRKEITGQVVSRFPDLRNSYQTDREL